MVIRSVTFRKCWRSIYFQGHCTQYFRYWPYSPRWWSIPIQTRSKMENSPSTSKTNGTVWPLKWQSKPTAVKQSLLKWMLEICCWTQQTNAKWLFPWRVCSICRSSRWWGYLVSLAFMGFRGEFLKSPCCWKTNLQSCPRRKKWILQEVDKENPAVNYSNDTTYLATLQNDLLVSKANAGTWITVLGIKQNAERSMFFSWTKRECPGLPISPKWWWWKQRPS